MKLSYKLLGNGAPFVVLHGLYGSSTNWFSFAKDLSDKFKFYLIDLRNHGSSEHDDDMNYPVMADDLHIFFVEHRICKAVLMGHSMGGKVAMQFALQHPQMIEKLIVVDIVPKSYLHLSNFSEHFDSHKNIITKLYSLNLSGSINRNELEIDLAKAINSKRIAQFLMMNLKRNVDDTYKWQINIDAIKNNLHNIIANIQFDTKSKCNIPTLFVRGADSDYISDNDFFEAKQIFVKAILETVANAGHWVSADNYKGFVEIVKKHLL